jgi:hypothetical protein
VVDPGRANGTDGHNRATILAVLLVPAVVLGGFSMWFFEASWIGVAMLLVGVVVAVLGSIRPVKTSSLLQILVVEVGLLVVTAVIGFAIDCGRNCS